MDCNPPCHDMTNDDADAEVGVEERVARPMNLSRQLLRHLLA